MGTRNLTAVMVGGKYALAQYGQWDGYPEGQGATALQFCREHLSTQEGVNRFKAQLSRVRFVEDENELKSLYASVGIDPNKEFITAGEGAKFDKKYPYFSRDHGAKILALVMEASGEVLTSNAIKFAGDSLFCEWGYVIDLDKCTFEVFEGFNKEALGADERFASAPSDDGYFPIKLRAKWKLDDLPSEETFLETFENHNEDD
jgi:hypothetical protein